MTEDEARKVCKHCIDAWPAGPKAYTWREVVIELEYNAAVRAYRTLVRKSLKAPTIGAFVAEYANTHRPHTEEPDAQWTGDEISLSEYLKRLTERANAGNTDAAEELTRWTRWLTPR